MDTARDHSTPIVLKALRGEAVPRIPAGPLAVHVCARWAGVSVRRYTTDASALAGAVLRYHEAFRPDAVWVSADTWVTAQAMGAAVDFPGDDQPMAGTGSPRIRKASDLASLPPPDPTAQGRWPLMLEAVRRVRAGLGHDACLVACFDQYPFSLACALLGLDRAMLALRDDRPLLEAVMERGLEYALAYGRALAGAGADLLSGGDSPAGLIGGPLYREVVLPFERRLVAALKSSTERPVSLHICGNATPLLADMAATGADVLEIDHPVDLPEACGVVGPGVGLWGNLDPVGLLARGGTEDVRRAVRRMVRAVAARGHRRFVLSSGCTLAWETPPDNLRALLEEARQSLARGKPCERQDARP
jgi:MtaA/CmuA family methyltransferase